MKIRGFTLIELLLYVSIIGVVIITMSSFLSTMQHQGVRTKVMMEVEDQSVAPMQIMTQIIRNATTITSPATGTSGSAATVSGTLFTLSSGAITMKEGSGAAVPLTSARVLVSNLTFTNLTATSPGTLRIQYTVSYNNPDGMPDFTYNKTVTGSATLR
jgi:Tfp pilus assembly protein FimT